MSIDWSKAPEGATHYHHNLASPWLKDGEVPMYFYPPFWMRYGSPMAGKAHIAHAVPRPAAPATAPTWDGQGLPPVGIECETWHVCKPDDITVRKILFMGSSLVVMSDKLRGEVTGRLEKVQFRPLRTPEQIAAEEREKAIDSMLDLDPPHESGFGMTSRRQFCEILFDAGYRRQEEGK